MVKKRFCCSIKYWVHIWYFSIHKYRIVQIFASYFAWLPYFVSKHTLQLVLFLKKVTENAKMCSNYFKGYIMNLKWIYQRKRSSLSFKHPRYQETYDNSVLTLHTPRYIPCPTVYYNCRCARGGPSKPCRQRHCQTMLIYPLKTSKSNTGSSQIYNRLAGSMRIWYIEQISCWAIQLGHVLTTQSLDL